MKIKRVWNTLVLTLAAGSLWTMAQGCGPSIGSFCNKVCDCMGCSDSERDDCVDSLEDQRKAAEDEDCGGEFNDYLSCTSSELECEDDIATADGCDSEAEKLAECTKGSVVGGNAVLAYCNNACDCTGCTDSEMQECVTSVEAFRDDSQAQGCGTEVDAYIACLASAQCQGGNLSLDGCEAQANAFANCFSGGSGSGSGGAEEGSSGAGGAGG